MYLIIKSPPLGLANDWPICALVPPLEKFAVVNVVDLINLPSLMKRISLPLRVTANLYHTSSLNVSVPLLAPVPPSPSVHKAHLSGLVSQELGLRCRSEKPGICGRSSILHVSPVDQEDAEQAGRAAVDAAFSGHNGQMITLLPRRKTTEPIATGLVPLTVVANNEKLVPDEWIRPSGTFVTESFCEYVRPLIGPDLLSYVRLD